jgi:hypothetical protein
MGKITYRQGYQNCSSERGLRDDPIKNILAKHCKIKRRGKGLARSLKEKDCGKKENNARCVNTRNRRRSTRKGWWY